MALYHTYRPRRLADVVGQDHIVTTLERAIEKKQLSHAYLFSGTRGTGKTSVARIIARTIIEETMTNDVLRPAIIESIEDGSCIDCIEIDAASNRRIDDIRELIERVQFAPSIAGAKVYIIDEVHMMTKEAFNALLKTLEEPPPYAYFILATTEMHRVPETIQSRCQRFIFRRVREEDIIQRLQFIVDQEKIVIDREALRAIAHHARGSFRDGIALLDQLQSLDRITLKEIEERIGGNAHDVVVHLEGALHAKDTKGVVQAIRSIEDAGFPIDRICTSLLERARDRLHNAIHSNAPLDEAEEEIEGYLQCLRHLRLSPLPAIALESALLTIIQRGTNSGASVAQQSMVSPPAAKAPIVKPYHPETTRQSIESTSRSTVLAIPSVEDVLQAQTVPPTVNQNLNKNVIQASDLTIEKIKEVWTNIVSRMTPASAKMSLKDATIRSVNDTTLTLGFSSDFSRQKALDPKGMHALQQLLKETFHRNVAVEGVLDDTHAMPANTAETNLKDAVKEVFG